MTKPKYRPSRVRLAPMAGVTDKPFRQIVREQFGGGVTTEMVSVSALYFKDHKTELLMDIEGEYDAADPSSRSRIALQIFTKDPDRIEAVAPLLSAHPAGSVDINMGCPAPKITGNGEGSALMRDIDLAERIIRSAVRTVDKPITVKFRSGWDQGSINAVEFARMCESAGATAITVHPRTREQMYEGHSDWNLIAACKRAVSIPVIGNGDIHSPEDAKRMLDETGCDAVMIGRASMGNPWLLGQIERYLDTGELPKPIDLSTRLETALRHFALLVEHKTEHIAVLEMRKHASWYLKGLPGSAAFKSEVNRATTAEQVIRLLQTAFR
ncbi:MAG: tRNA dihydrouridine synthase DusB [Bacillota bacterium]|nr:tRNA dihydrouridine synthase DusB [Bacillota bacterium]